MFIIFDDELITSIRRTIIDFINDRTPIVIHVNELNDTLKRKSANVRYTHRCALKPIVRYAQRVERPQTRLRILLHSV